MASYDTEGTGAGTISAYDTGRGTPRHDAYDTGNRPTAADLYDTGKRTGKDQSYDTGKAPGQEDPYDTKSTYLDAGRNVAGSPAQVPGPIEMVARTSSGTAFSSGYSQAAQTFRGAALSLRFAGTLIGGAVAQDHAIRSGYDPSALITSKSAADYLRNRAHETGEVLAGKNIFVSHVSTDTLRTASLSGPVSGLAGNAAGFLIAGRALTKEEKSLVREQAETLINYRRAMNSSIAGSRLISGGISSIYHGGLGSTDFEAGASQADRIRRTGLLLGKTAYYTVTRGVDVAWAGSAIYQSAKAASYARKAARAEKTGSEAASLYRNLAKASRAKARSRVNSFLTHRENQGLREAVARNLTDPSHIIKRAGRAPIVITGAAGKAIVKAGRWASGTRAGRWVSGTRAGKAVKKVTGSFADITARYVIKPVTGIRTLRKMALSSAAKTVGRLLRPLLKLISIGTHLMRLPFYLLAGAMALAAMISVIGSFIGILLQIVIIPQAAITTVINETGIVQWVIGEDAENAGDSILQLTVDRLFERQMEYGTQIMEGDGLFSDLEDLKLYRATLNNRRISGSGLGKIGRSAEGYTATLPVTGKGTMIMQEEVDADLHKKLLTKPAVKEVPGAFRTGDKIALTYVLRNGAARVEQTLYEGAAGTEYMQHLGDRCALERDTSYVNGWTYVQNMNNYASVTYDPYEAVTKKTFEDLRASARESGGVYYVTLYAHWKDKIYKDVEYEVTSSKDYSVSVGDSQSTRQYLGIDSMNVQYAFTDDEGEIQYTDDEGEVSTFSSASLYKAIVIMATIATQNDVTVKNVDDAYYRYCQKLLDTAFTSSTGYEVNYHSQALTGTAREGEGYSWEENGTTFTADRVVLTADITVYVGCYLEDLMDSDGSDAESMKKLGFVNSTFEGWTKENRDLAWTYMKLDDESFQKLFNVTFPYGLSMSGNVWGYIEEALRMAADNSIGYDWDTRCLNPNVDCSSFVYYSLKKAGFDMGLGYPFTTSGMGTVLQNLGFVKIPIKSAMPLMEGDILWWDGAGYLGHTEIYIGNNQMVGAHGKNGIAKPDQVSICTYSQGSFTHVFRLSVPACNYDFFGKTDASQSPGVQAVQSCINYYEAGLRKLNSSGKKMQYSNHGWASNYFRRFDKLLASRDRDPAGRIYYSANCDSGHMWVQQDLLSPSQGYYQVSGIWNDVTASVMKGGSKSFRYLVDSNLLQPGDLIVFKTHRFIYYGKGLVFDTGHGSKWYRDGSISHTDKYKAVFRSFLIPVRNSSDYTRDGTFRVKRVKAGFIPRYYRSASGLLVPIRKLEDND